MANKEKNAYSIQSVDNALDVLEALCTEEGDVRVSHLSKRLGMTKMSLFRYLATFESRGYVEKTKENGRYRLGLTAYETGQKLLARNTLLREAKPVIEQLARLCNEAVYLVVPRGNEVLLLDMVDTTQLIKIVPLVGNRYPAAATSSGRAMLAHSDTMRAACEPEELDAIKALLTVIHEQGFDYDRGGYGEGIASLSAPLFKANGDICGCISLVGPEFRVTRKLAEEKLLPGLVDAGIVISSKLGYVGHFIGKTLYR